MLQISDLKSVKTLSNLSEPMLDKIKKITVVRKYTNNDCIFKEGDYAEHLFAVVVGKVSLEIDGQSGNLMRVKDIYPGRVFGIS